MEQPLVPDAQSLLEQAAKIDRFPWLAKKAIPCMDTPGEEDINAHGADEEDESYMEYEYSLMKFKYKSDEPKVEIEDTENPEMQEAAKDRIGKIYGMMIPTGVALWFLSVGGGMFSGYVSDCTAGTPVYLFGFVAAAVGIQLYQIEQMTLLLSKTSFEGRPLVRMICSLKGLDHYHVMTIMAVVDLFGRFTRALFVGFACRCGTGINEPLVESWKTSPVAFTTPVVEFIGIEGLSMLSFVAGPLIVQGGYMLWERSKAVKAMRRAFTERGPNESMGISNSADELSAIAEWAMMGPVGKVFDLAAIPLVLEDLNDAQRMWERMKATTAIRVSKCIPDSVFQMSLQARFLALAFPSIDPFLQAQLVLNIVMSGLDALLCAIDMLTLNRVLTLMAAVVVFFPTIGPWIRMFAAFLCEAHVINISSLECVEPGSIQYGNWTGSGQGLLPG